MKIVFDLVDGCVVCAFQVGTSNTKFFFVLSDQGIVFMSVGG
jgi:hypothetical protein